MKKLSILLAIILLTLPAWSEKKDRGKTYVAKTKKSVKYKKKKYKKRIYIRKYPVRSNTASRGEELKLQEMLKDIYE